MSPPIPQPLNEQRRAAVARALGDSALRLCTIPETCELLRVSRWQVYQLINKRELPSVKIGRRRLVPVVDIERYVAALRAEATL